MIKSALFAIPKLLYFILCYAIAFVLAIVSGYFTVEFYRHGTTGNDFYIMTGLSIALEFTKIMFSAAYPFMKYRDLSIEKKVLLVIKLTLIISILASLNYLLLGRDTTISPASKTIAMLYDNMPFLAIIPLKFSQFLGTISLSVLIECFIVLLPISAPVMFKPRDYTRKTYAISNLDKIKEIFVVIPERVIDRLHKRIVGVQQVNVDGTVRSLEEYKQGKELNTLNTKNENINNDYDKHIGNKKLLDTLITEKDVSTNDVDKIKGTKNDIDTFNTDNEYTNIDLDKHIKDIEDISCSNTGTITSMYTLDKSLNENIDIKQDSESINKENFVHDKDTTEFSKNCDKKILLRAIYKYKIGNTCPSVVNLVKYTNLAEGRIIELKNYFAELGILRIVDNSTFTSIDTYDNALKLIADGGSYYEK